MPDGRVKNGGARAGAGRKPTALRFESQVLKAKKKIADNLPMLVDKALELAEGVLVEDVNIITMERSVYQKPPDLGAIKYLMDRIMGKPTEHKEHTFFDTPLEDMSEDELRAIRDS